MMKFICLHRVSWRKWNELKIGILIFRITRSLRDDVAFEVRKNSISLVTR